MMCYNWSTDKSVGRGRPCRVSGWMVKSLPRVHWEYCIELQFSERILSFMHWRLFSTGKSDIMGCLVSR